MFRGDAPVASSSAASTSRTSSLASRTSASTSRTGLGFLSQSFPPPSASDASFSSKIFSNTSRTGTDLTMTTPSLCSDTEGDPSFEDHPPPTPPMSAVPDSRSASVDGPRKQRYDRPLPADRPREEDVEMGHLRRSPSPILQRPYVVQRPPVLARTSDVFASRPPSSPLRLDSPKKPRPPGRPKPKVVENLDGASDDDDPLVLSYSAPRPEDDIAQPVPQRPLQPTFQTESRSASRASGSSRLPVPVSRKPSRSATRDSSLSSSATASKRSTLDDELRRADASVVADLEDELENGTFVGVGMRGREHGFLAHGGGGGVPVLMGVGNVENLEEMQEEQRSRRRRKSSTASRR